MGHYFYITPEEYNRAEIHGVCRQTLEYRVCTAAWEKEKAITTPPRKKGQYKEFIKIAERNGICRNTFCTRIYGLGWEPMRAASEPIISKQELAKRLNKTSIPQKYKDLAEKNGIKYSTLAWRIRKGWDFLKASTLAPTAPNKRREMAPVNVN